MPTSTLSAVFARETLATFWLDCQSLLPKNWVEISSDLDIPLNVSLARYEQLESVNCLRIYTVRQAPSILPRQEAILIGYAVFFLNVDPHYQVLQALSDVVYLDPEWRKGALGVRLIRYAEQELRSDGAVFIHYHVKPEHPVLGFVLERLGYRAQEVKYRKRVGG